MKKNEFSFLGKNGNRIWVHVEPEKKQVTVILRDPYEHAILDSWYVADILTSICLGKKHVPALPDYCKCKRCRNNRLRKIAREFHLAQAEALAASVGAGFPTE